jgi:hypothetical protein
MPAGIAITTGNSLDQHPSLAVGIIWPHEHRIDEGLNLNLLRAFANQSSLPKRFSGELL